MLGVKCKNDLFGYCSDRHRHQVSTHSCSDIGHPGVHVLAVKHVKPCQKDPQKCGFFVTWKEVCLTLNQ